MYQMQCYCTRSSFSCLGEIPVKLHKKGSGPQTRLTYLKSFLSSRLEHSKKPFTKFKVYRPSSFGCSLVINEWVRAFTSTNRYKLWTFINGECIQSQDSCLLPTRLFSTAYFFSLNSIHKWNINAELVVLLTC